MSKLTRTLNCSISFYPDYCLIQDHLKKRIISRGHESRGLFILETEVPKSIACSGIVTPFKLHCRLMFQMPMPKHFWVDVVSIACFLINQMSSSVLNWATPFQIPFPHKSLFPIKPRVWVYLFGSGCLSACV